jgi:hypothetical protein
MPLCCKHLFAEGGAGPPGMRTGPGLCRVSHTYSGPQHVVSPGPTARDRTPRFRPYRTADMQDSASELPRIHLLGRWVNRGKNEGRD